MIMDDYGGEQMEEEFSMSAKDVVKRLNSAFRQFK